MIFHFSFPTFFFVVADAVIFMLNFSYIFIFFLSSPSYRTTLFLRECYLYVPFPARALHIDEIFMFSSRLFTLFALFCGLDNRLTELGPKAGDDLDRDYWSCLSVGDLTMVIRVRTRGISGVLGALFFR